MPEAAPNQVTEAYPAMGVKQIRNDQPPQPPWPPVAPARAQAIGRFEARDYPAAVRLLAPLLAQDPSDALLHRLRGMALVRTGAAPDGVTHLRRARELAPAEPLGALWHGIALQAAGRPADAVVALEAASVLAPGDPAPLIHLSRALLHLRQPEAALAAARRAASLAPALTEAEHAVRLSTLAALQALSAAAPQDLAAAWLALGRVCMRLDKVSDARAAFMEALGLQPLLSEAEAELALAEHLCGQPLTAVARLRAVLERDPGCLPARLHLASRLLLDGEAHQALALLDTGLEPADGPMRPHWHAHRTQALVALGRAEAALRELARAERFRAPELELSLCWQRLVLSRRGGDQRAAALAERAGRLAGRREAGTLEQRIDAHFDLAELHRTDGRHAEAFAHWRHGHGLMRAAQPFSRAEHAATVTAITAGFDRRRLADGPRSGLRDPAPVFVVGLPRTGTTLLEQILSAHPAVHGAGERLAIRETLARLTGTKAAGTAATRAAALDSATLTTASHDYLAALHALAPDATRILDKMPENFFQLGFISTLLPGALIICCTRDLRDVGASIFQHRFIGHHPYAHDLADLGWYMANHVRLLEHWRTSLPSPMLLLDHSDWLRDFDGTLRRVLAFLELPYDPACERFFERDRPVATASREQVRRPINAAGVGRWRDYAEQLAPMLRELPPID